MFLMSNQEVNQMEKRNKIKFIKNRTWKSKCYNRLKGKPEEVCRDYFNGIIDKSYIMHVKDLEKRGE